MGQWWFKPYFVDLCCKHLPEGTYHKSTIIFNHHIASNSIQPSFSYGFPMDFRPCSWPRCLSRRSYVPPLPWRSSVARVRLGSRHLQALGTAAMEKGWERSKRYIKIWQNIYVVTHSISQKSPDISCCLTFILHIFLQVKNTFWRPEFDGSAVLRS